jgi:hypothetical protein
MNGWGMYQAISSWMNMYVMRMHENGLEVENDSYSGRGVWVIYGGTTVYDMHDNEWECMRMAENG